MAHPNMFTQQPRGTLMPGQIIAVNKYTVQVERYLSQGGFAHVYLVRTAEPVFNTTHHVLKRIAVQSESMLNEVKKEVDIMRILRGHPNIVYLIDAAWHKTPEGMYEVFILMEFCPGGGIIDMMNRRLRERLTETDILQIFVDVCEGVAAMHNLRPPLLHRDLKVENILQASETSFKLCDFGSATPVAMRPASTIQDLRALEADLNRHTTLQYRPPEMVDVYLRRPVDEKSDVWALGVLLYKLCYYTTPFEEHGILAILNVQYKIPPYPVYSTQLNALIASMLREHGSQRPTVFELLDTVHKLRGTRSKFTYTPPPVQPLSPRVLPAPPHLQPKPQDSISSGSSRSNAIQARDQVLQAIAPMRRGRPPSPTKGRSIDDALSQSSFSGNRGLWPTGAARAHKSGLASVSAGGVMRPTKAPSVPVASSPSNDAWRVTDSTSEKNRSQPGQPMRATNGFGDSFDASLRSSVNKNMAKISTTPSNDPKLRLYPFSVPANGDAFDSLSVFLSKPPAMTLGEAQKAMSKTSPAPSPRPSDRPLPSPVPSLHTKLQSPALSGSSNISMQTKPLAPLPKSRLGDQSLAPEHRFPSLEDLDAHLSSTPSPTPQGQPALPPRPQPQPQLPPRPSLSEKPSASPLSTSSGIGTSWKAILNVPIASGAVSGLRQDGVRSQQVTGTAMREGRHQQRVPSSSSLRSQDRALPDLPPSIPTDPKPNFAVPRTTPKLDGRNGAPVRPTVVRKHRSSTNVKPRERRTGDLLSPVEGSRMTEEELKKATDARLVSPITAAFPPPKDWLTGDDTTESPIPRQVTLRASPEKRASVSMSPVPFERPLEATHEISPKKPLSISLPPPATESSTRLSPSPMMLARPLARSVNNSKDSSDEENEGPEEAERVAPSRSVVHTKKTHNARQTSVHELADFFGGSTGSEKIPSATSKSDKRRSMILSSSGPSVTDSPLPNRRTNTGISSATPTDKWTKPSISPLKPSSERKPVGVLRRIPSLSAGSGTGSTPPSPAPTKSRPQSMLILPMSKAVSDGLGTASPRSPALSSMSHMQTQVPPQQLQLPLDPGMGKARSGRRSSISEMVSHYEAIGGSTNMAVAGLVTGNSVTSVGSKVAKMTTGSSQVQAQTQHERDTKSPPLPAKPARLKSITAKSSAGVSSTSTSDSASVSSPTSASLRFPRISPTSSPSKSTYGSSLTVRTGSGAGIGAGEPKRPVSPVKRKPSPSPSLYENTTSTVTSPPIASKRAPSPLLERRQSPSPTPIQQRMARGVHTTTSTPIKKAANEPPAAVAPIVTSTATTKVEELRKTFTPTSSPAMKTKSLSTTTDDAYGHSFGSSSVNPVNATTRSHSPERSPERPFQGVSKLINQWQKKTEELERGRTPTSGASRFRREGLVKE